MRFFIFLGYLIISTLSVFSQTNDDKELILKNLYTSQEGWNEGNWEKYMSGYKNSDSIRFVGGGNCTYGWETVLTRYKKAYPDKTAMGILSFSEINVNILSDKFSLVLGKWSLRREKDNPWGLFTLIFEKTKEGWKIIHDHSSSAEK